MSEQTCDVCNSRLKLNRELLLVCEQCAIVYDSVEPLTKNISFNERNSIAHNYKLPPPMRKYRIYNERQNDVFTYILRYACETSKTLELTENQRHLLIENSRKICNALKTSPKKSIFLALFLIKDSLSMNLKTISEVLGIRFKNISKLIIELQQFIRASHQKNYDETCYLNESICRLRNSNSIRVRAIKKSVNFDDYVADLERESMRIFNIITKKHPSIVTKNRVAFSILHAVLNLYAKYSFRIKVNEISNYTNTTYQTVHTGYIYRSECK